MIKKEKPIKPRRYQTDYLETKAWSLPHVQSTVLLCKRLAGWSSSLSAPDPPFLLLSHLRWWGWVSANPMLETLWPVGAPLGSTSRGH